MGLVGHQTGLHESFRGEDRIEIASSGDLQKLMFLLERHERCWVISNLVCEIGHIDTIIMRRSPQWNEPFHQLSTDVENVSSPRKEQQGKIE